MAKKEPVIGICKLCLKEKELIRSHIIPEFMYQNLYDDNPRNFFEVEVNREDGKDVKKTKHQKGIRKHLTCKECDNGILSKYESYAATTIYAKKDGCTVEIVKQERTDDKRYTIHYFEGFDYTKFKIFENSILWQLLITDEIPDYEGIEATKEELRLSLLNEQPLGYDKYGCALNVIRYNPETLATKFILGGYVGINRNGRILFKMIDGFLYIFYLENDKVTNTAKEFFLQINGNMKMMGRMAQDDAELFDRIKKGFAGYDEKNNTL